MSLPVAVYRGGRFSHFLKVRKAERKVRTGSYRWRVGERAIEEMPPLAIEQLEEQLASLVLDRVSAMLTGAGQLIPFSRVQDRMKKPHKLHYAIPAVGARSRPQYCSEINSAGEREQAS